MKKESGETIKRQYEIVEAVPGPMNVAIRCILKNANWAIIAADKSPGN